MLILNRYYDKTRIYWLIFPDAITGEGKVWTIDGLLEPCIKPDNEVWVDSTVENPFAGPITYKGKNKYGW